MADPFVDMEQELTGFREVLHTPSYRLVLVEGEAGMGKSTLLTQFRKAAEQEQVPCALVNFKPPADHSPLSVIYEVAGLIDLEGCANLQEVQQALAAQVPTIVVKDIRAMFKSQVNIQVAVSALSSELNQRDWRDRDLWHMQFTVAFFNDLDESLIEHIVLFMDTCEECSETVSVWVSTHLLPMLRKQEGLKVVIAGERVPELDAEWTDLHVKMHLDGVALPFWQEYLDLQQAESVDPKHVEAAYMLYDGRPLDMVSATEIFREKAPHLCQI